MPSQTIPCAECKAMTTVVEAGGRYKVTGCEPITDDAGWCLLSYELRSGGAAALGAAGPSGALARKSSRDPRDLHPELARRWQLAREEFKRRHPGLPEVFLTQTFRSDEDQAQDYAKGRIAAGKVVTNAQPGQSLHNYYPALAFDVAFKRGAALDWDIELFRKFAAIAKSFGLEWGGDWPRFQDNPHFQVAGYTWQMARDGRAPVFTALA